MSGPQFANFRRFVLTGSIAAVTATGAWYGAGLKMKQDIKQVYLTLHLSLSTHLSALFAIPLSVTNLSFVMYRRNKKQQSQHHSNKLPNWKPTVPI
jgi:hypothetical protein